jgi:large subunit ribosomal protein L25
MAKQIKLSAQTRPHVGRSAVKKLKKSGIVPAVIYGGKEQPQTLQISARDIDNILAHASGENVLVDLEIEGGGHKVSRMALIQEVQHHPLGGHVLHVDFRAVSMTEKINANIPVESIGEANGVKNFGGILEQSMRSIEVECLPKDLPDILRVDVSNLNIGDAIHVREIPLPPGVIALENADLTVFLVAAPTVEEVAPVAAEAITQPEVIKEKKEEVPAAEGKGEKPEKGEKGEKK